MSKMPVNSDEAREWMAQNGGLWFGEYCRRMTAEEAKLDALPMVLAVLLSNAVPAYPGDGTAALANLIANLVKRAETSEMWNNGGQADAEKRIADLLRANNELVERERAAKREAAGWRSIVEDAAKGETGRMAAARIDAEIVAMYERATGNKVETVSGPFDSGA